MESMNKVDISINIASSVILSSCISIQSRNDGNAVVKRINTGSNVRVLSPDDEIIFDSEESTDGIIAQCCNKAERNFVIEIEKSGLPLFRLKLSCGKSGGWYAAGKHFIGGLITIMIADCSSGCLHLVDPASYAGRVNEVKSNAMLDNNSEELFIILKESLPLSLFSELPLIPLKKKENLK